MIYNTMTFQGHHVFKVIWCDLDLWPTFSDNEYQSISTKFHWLLDYEVFITTTEFRYGEFTGLEDILGWVAWSQENGTAKAQFWGKLCTSCSKPDTRKEKNLAGTYLDVHWSIWDVQPALT